ncbi:MAG TPA: hypothetical protein DEV93_13925 [Chloroflexi bacterium]|nr:hypothetical protein [Chloroflexota bacterium]
MPPPAVGSDRHVFDAWPTLRPPSVHVNTKLPADRACSWLGQSRRLAEEYERLCETSEAMIYVTMSRIMLKRLAHS